MQRLCVLPAPRSSSLCPHQGESVVVTDAPLRNPQHTSKSPGWDATRRARKAPIAEAGALGQEQLPSDATVQVISRSLAETRRVGRCLGSLLAPGDLILLFGPFGAGKTSLTQGIARGMGIGELVTSPSFTLVNQYRGQHRHDARLLYHIDLYRLTDPGEALALGLEEYVTPGAICVIEWPEQAAAILPAERVEIRMAYLGQKDRILGLAGHGMRGADLAVLFARAWASRRPGA